MGAPQMQHEGARCQGIAAVHLCAVAVGVPGIAGGTQFYGVGQAPVRGQHQAGWGTGRELADGVVTVVRRL
jgi:hypothetical protein